MKTKVPYILIAILPSLAGFTSYGEASMAGVFLILACLVTCFFFRATEEFFPLPVRFISKILWLLAAALFAWYLVELKPFWVASLGLLSFQKDFFQEGLFCLEKDENAKDLFAKVLLVGIFYAFFLFCYFVLGHAYGVIFFLTPAGVLFLMAAIAFFSSFSREETSK